ncbi:MAG: PDZ domain-containing protein [Pirellulales bacterium]
MKKTVWLGVVTSVVGALLMSNSVSWAQEAAPESPPAQQQNVPFFFQNQPAYSELITFQNQPAADYAVNVKLATFGNPLGVEAAAVEAALRAQLNIDEGKGVVITSVREDSEAAKAGLKQHDILLAVDEQPIESPEKLHEMVASRQGQEVQFQVLRQGKPESLRVALAKTPVYQFHKVYVGDLLTNVAGTASQYRIGVQLAEADDALRSQLRLAAGEGLVVTEVLPDSPVAKAGIRQHDVLIKLDGKRLSTVENINALIQEIKDRHVLLVFVRGGEEMLCEVTPQLSSEPAAGLILKNYNQLLEPVVVQDQLRLIYQPWAGLQNKPAPPTTTAADQVAALKKQLAEMQQSLEALEASLGQQPAAEPPPPAEPPQEQPPPQADGEN